MKIETSYLVNSGVCEKSFLLSLLIAAMCSSWAFAVDSTEIEAAMCRYQNIYHYVGVVESSGNKYVSWPGVKCLSMAPSYPTNYYGDITEAKAIELVNNLVSQFYGGGIYEHFIEDVNDQNEITHVQVTEPNSTDSWHDKLVQVNGDLNRLTMYNAGCPSEVNTIDKTGGGQDQPTFENYFPDCDWHRTKNGSFSTAVSEAKSSWSDSNSWESCLGIGVVASSTHLHAETVYCNGTSTLTSDGYGASILTMNTKYQQDLTRHTGTAAFYIMLSKHTVGGGLYCMGYYGYEGEASYAPVNVDEKYHSWGSPQTGVVWKSDYLFSTAVPEIPAALAPKN